MNAHDKLVRILVGVEVVIAAVLFGARLTSTCPVPPLVDQYSDAATGREVLALPDQFLFDSPEKFQTLGETYLAFGYFSKADACLRRASESKTPLPEIDFTHGFCLERLGKIEDAIKLFRRSAQRASPKLAEAAWYHVGRNSLRLEQPEAAAEAFEQAGKRHSPSVYQRAKLMVRAGRSTEAEPLLQQLTAEYPNEVHIMQLNEQAHHQLGREVSAAMHDALERAIPVLKLDDSPEYLPRIRERFGLALEVAQVNREQREGRLLQAADRITKLVRDETHWPNRYLWLLLDAAALQLETQNTTVARQLIELWFDKQRFPTPRAWELRGDVEFADGDFPLALEAWQHADRMRPTRNVQMKLARLAEGRGDASAQRRHLGAAGQIAGIELFRANQLEPARTTLRQATTFDDKLPELWFYLGETERLLGKPAEAEVAYRRCLELNPDHPRASRHSTIEFGD